MEIIDFKLLRYGSTVSLRKITVLVPGTGKWREGLVLVELAMLRTADSENREWGAKLLCSAFRCSSLLCADGGLFSANCVPLAAGSLHFKARLQGEA
jgi:hypothetical protein